MSVKDGKRINENQENNMKVKGKKLVKKSRKQIRKEKRQEKKAKKNDYYQNRHKPGKFVLLPKNFEEDEAESPEPKITQKLKVNFYHHSFN